MRRYLERKKSEMMVKVTFTVWLNQDARRRLSSCLMVADGRRRQWTGQARTRAEEERSKYRQVKTEREDALICDPHTVQTSHRQNCTYT